MVEGSSTLGGPGSHLATARPTGDPNVLGPILEMGSTGVRRGLVIGIALAFVVHGYLVARVALALIDMGHFVRDAREEAHAYFWATYDIETDKKEEPKQEKEEPEPDPIPEPEPEPEIVRKPIPKEDIYQQAAARPAAAPDTVTSKDDSQAPEDFYGVVDNDGSNAFGTGKVANNGQGDHVDPSKKTSPTGTGSGNGNDKKDTPPPKKVDLSRPATLVGSTSWSCPFPPEADAEGKDSAVAVIVVTVRPDGTPASVSVVQDPGAGFGRAARKCALGRRYDAGLDKDGQKTTTTTPPIRVKFSR
jgi:protein TonB